MQLTIQATTEQRLFYSHILENDECDVVAYGGARFGGKTWAACTAAVLLCLRHPGAQILMLRKVSVSARHNIGKTVKAVIERSFNFPPNFVRELKADRQFVFPNGSVIQLGYCRLEGDWERYKGSQWDFVFMEEATTFPEETFNGLSGSCRPNVPGVHSKMILTTNPDGIGLGWVRSRIIREETREPRVVFIQSLVSKCMATLEHDPGYVKRILRKLPEHMRRQWELGDWDSVEGAMFPVTEKLFAKCNIPLWAEIYEGVDFGWGAGAFAVVFAAVWKDYRTGKNRVHFFREIKRHRLSMAEQARAALEIEDELARDAAIPRRISARFADPSVFRSVPGALVSTTTAHVWATYGWPVVPALSNSRVPGWNLMRTAVTEGIITIDPEKCPNFVQEYRDAIMEPHGEDLHKLCYEDHCLDAARYLLVSVCETGDVTIDVDRQERIARRFRVADYERNLMREVDA